MSLQILLACVTIVASVGVILREAKARGNQLLAVATLAIGILQVIHSRGRLVRYIARLDEAGTALAFASLVIGLVLYVRMRDKTFSVLLVFAGALLLLLDLELIERL
jgi:hypothetical protein